MAIELDYKPADLVDDLRRIAARTKDPLEIVQLVRAPARRLALAKGWLTPNYFECDAEQGFSLHLLHEEADHGLAAFVASWLPGHGVVPHNHGTWAVVTGMVGRETNVFWRRTDDRSRPGHAKLEETGRTVFGPGEVVHFMPDDIHSVRNETDAVTVSLHIYGRHINHTHRSKFDPAAEREEPFELMVE
jgi:predicted metal-dependent enzyme (double-stranded beta helix superfamily)